MNLKSLIPHGVAIIIFFLLTVVVFHPQFFDGKELSQHDIQQSTGANHQLQDYRAKTGEEALWLPTMFSGMPAYLNGVQYSGDFLKYVYRVASLGLSHPTGIPFLAFLSFYILLISLKVRPGLAIAGAILFGLNGFNIISISAGHNAKIAAVALMPLVLAGFRFTFSGRRWLGLGLTAIALALQIRAGHPQMTYYLLLITVAYVIYELIQAIRSSKLKPFMLSVSGLVLAAMLAVAANAGKLYHTYEYGKSSTRGKSELTQSRGTSGLDYEYAFRYSNSIAEPMVMFFPNILGGSSSQKLSNKSNTAEALMNAGYSRLQAQQQVQSMPTYWGDQPLTAPYYAGSILFFLFVLGVITLPRKEKIWLISIALFGVMLSWGKNFSGLNNLLFDYLPAYNKFRSVTFTIIIPIIAINLLAFLGIEHWLKKDKAEQWEQLKLAGMIAGGFCLFLLLISGMFGYKGAVDTQLPDWLIGALRDDRKSLFRMDVFRGLAFTIIAAGILWSSMKEKLSNQTALILLCILTVIDILPLSKRFLNKENFKENVTSTYFQPTAADTYLMATANAGDRVLNLQNPWNEARTSYFHESIGGYHGAKMRRYNNVIERYLSDEVNEIVTTIQAGSRDFSSLSVLNMLNARFFVAGSQKEAVLQNPYAYGQAWIAKEVVNVSTPDEEINALQDTSLKSKAIINSKDFGSVRSSGEGTVSLLDKTPNELTYEANIEGETAVIVFSEIYYPNGWSAYIDDKPVDILRANYILRALEVPEGTHDITFRFEPKSYSTTQMIMAISSIIILLGFIGGFVYDKKMSTSASA